MSATMQLPKPEQLVDLISHAAAVKLAMDGEFDAKIAQYKEAEKSLWSAQTIVATLEEAQKIKADADAYAAAALSKAKDALSRAQDATDKAASREATVSARESAVGSRESAADSRQATQDTREQAFLNAQVSASDALAAREVALKKAEVELVGKVKKLAADQAAFNQRLDSLKV